MTDTKFRVQLTESFAPQSLGADVRQLLQRPNGLDLNPVLLDALADIMVFDINMLTSIMEHGIPAERDGGLVVDLECESSCLLSLDLC